MTLNDLIARHGWDKINSFTKYPSILTYHHLGIKGGLKDELIDGGFPDSQTLEITEKVDGTNGRLVFFNGDYLIGQRERFEYARGDRVINSEVVDPIKQALRSYIDYGDDMFTVIYGEVYGHRIQDGSKIYCADNNNQRKCRVFDVWQMAIDDVDKYLSDASNQQITFDREHNIQPWFSTEKLDEFCKEYDIDRTPIWMTIYSNDMPRGAVETKSWIEDNFKESHAIIGNGTGSNQKFARAEGIVVRTQDRSVIRKLRFEDYHKGEMKGWV